MVTDKDVRDKIVAQSLKEILWARKYKQGKVKNWQKNEEMYYGVKKTPTEARANVDLGRMQEFVHTLLSKIRRPLVFKYTKRKEAQLKRVKLLNAVREVDRKSDMWDLKDLVGKKQALIYGRPIYSYFADSLKDIGYRPHLENVDVYDYLIDPSAGGIDLEQARYMGNYGVVLDRSELEQGVKDGAWLKDEAQEILDGTGNNTEVSPEETNKLARMYGQNTIGKKELQSDDKFKFWRWFTTYEGKRYYLVLQERAGRAIRVEPLTDLFTPTKQFPKSAWPYWTWAAFPDLTEFWTPSYCDYVREIFMAQNVSIDQMLDNAEAVNKPQRVVNVGMIENLAELKYRKDGIIKVKQADFDVNKAYQTVKVESIQTPIMVFDTLEKIQEKASGVTADAKGLSDPDGKVGIYEGNKAEAADRFGLLDISYSFGYDRFARLHEIGIRDNLTKKVAIELTGPDGIETVEVSRRDLFKKGDELGVTVESSSDDMLSSEADKAQVIEFLKDTIQQQDTMLTQNPNAPKLINSKVAFELQGKMAGLKPEQIAELLDVSEYSTSEIMSEADRDIESLENGETIKPNSAANLAYMQRFIDWLTDHEEDMDEKTFKRFIDYMASLGNNVGLNIAREIQQHFIQSLNAIQPGTPVPANMGAVVAPPQPAQPSPPGAPVTLPQPAAPTNALPQ